MIKYLFAISFCFFYTIPFSLFAQENQGDTYTPTYKYSIAQLQSDFAVFRWVLEKAHPGLYSFTSKTMLDKQMDSTYNAITQPLNEREFYQMLAPIVADLHCGHTLLDPSLMYQDQGKRLPLDLFFQAGKAYIRYNYGEERGVKVPLGVQILTINGQTMEEVIARMLPNLPADALHIQGKYQDLEEDFANYYDLLIAQPDTFHLACLNTKTNETLELHVPALDDEFIREYSKRNLLDTEAGKKPLDFLLIDSLKTAVMYIHSFLDLDHREAKQRFGKFLKASMKAIKTHKIENLVIDVRQNSGGNLIYVNDLFYNVALKPYRFLDRVEVTQNKKITDLKNSELSRAAMHNPNRVISGDSGRYFVKDSYYTDLRIREANPKAFKGKVYLLTGKRSFSAASHLAVLFEAYKRGVIVGEETGGSNAGFNAGDIINIGLPITNLQLEVPMEKCMKVIPRYPYKARGVLPHHVVLNTIEDELKSYDRILAYTLQLIQKGR